ncbi:MULTISPECIES: glycine oxidase ThiO [Bacillaceae]|uniref:glycine oxidase ThiO n=1 Tax=Bacillaceae TaxID=186817 RepID=UPI001C583BAB|nr:glycine oxidase ThiO [Rossellomorea sp. YZS02]MBW3114481.1 glycine oxidase ThiO [Bacillus sp. MCCB 382]MDX8344400.1 glycine oxidase ThiO [Rossellomorea sp. YZS02]
MAKQYDVLIVGGGVIGCSILYQLTKRGKKALLIEKNQLASKASKAAAGMLGVHTELNGGSPLYRVAKNSRNMYPVLARELKEVTGMDIEYVENGMVKLARTEEEAQTLISVATKLDQDEEVEWLSSPKLSAFEPLLSKKATGGLFIPRDGNVAAPKLTEALGLASVRLGAQVNEYTDVYDFIVEGSRISGVQTSIGPLYASEIIVAGGAWSQSLLERVGVTLHSYPVKGECFSVKCSRKLVERTIFTEGCYIVPKVGGRFLIGATEHAHTFDETISVSGMMSLMKKATDILPELIHADWEKAWSGIRPQTQGGLPIIGRSERWEGLSIATGHYRNGILLAPITGVMMADLIEGKENRLLHSHVGS